MEEEAWQTEHFNSRRIGHGRKSGKGAYFDPRRSYGKYELRCPALAKLSGPSAESTGQGKTNATESIFEIHGPADTRNYTLICTIRLSNVLSGVALLAGTRKSLDAAVKELEQSDLAEARGTTETVPDAGVDDDGANASGEDEDEDVNEEVSELEGDNEIEEGNSNRIELADELDRRRQAAFEKNTFRSPKFWLRWRAEVPGEVSSISDTHTSIAQTKDVEVNGGYLVFGGNNCARFNGIINCDAFGWKNVKLSGEKITSRTTDCPLAWLDVNVDR